MLNMRKIIKSSQDGKKYDPDSSPEAWEAYLQIYRDVEFFQEYDKNSLTIFETRRPYNQANKYHYSNKEGEGTLRLNLLKEGYLSMTQRKVKYFNAMTRLGGDTIFNFNEKKYEKFKVILLGTEEGAVHIEELDKCKSMHHTLANFSIMQVMGNMQGVKSKGYGGEWLDRFDSYISIVNDYYQNENEFILSKSEKNKASLISFLKKFDNVYDYCKQIYFIEEHTFVDRIISEGKCEIEGVQDVVRYMDLANDYWDLKELVAQTKMSEA